MRGCGHESGETRMVAAPASKRACAGVEGYERLAEMALQLPTTRLVYLADREADIMRSEERRVGKEC